MGNYQWIKDVMRFLRLTHEQEDSQIIHDSIESAVVFRGTNLWILIFAILIASVGLNMNSTAVIIGAMLISPLMGPIAGVGYSIATYDRLLLRKSLKNYIGSGAAAILTSFIYFSLTPMHSEHSEILARTSPTIYDVFIALFGGLAGIVAISSKNKGNVIPGVAIATALMPPLCTAGYGLAIGNFGYFLGAIYLFLINSVFIALAAMLVSQLMKFPKKTFLLSNQIKSKNISIAIVVFLTIVPSYFLGVTLVNKQRFQERSEFFVEQVNSWEGNYLLRSNIDAEAKEIKLIYVGNEFDAKSVERIKEKAKDMGVGASNIIVEQGVKIKDYDKLMAEDDDVQKMSSELNQLRLLLLQSKKTVDSLEAIPLVGESLLKEIKPFFPEIKSCSYSLTDLYVDTIKIGKPVTMVYFDSEKELTPKDLVKLEEWVKTRLNTENVLLKF